MKKISVVIPMYYEEQVAEECYERVSKVLYDLRDKYDYFLSVFLHILVYKPGRLFIFRHFLIVFVKWHVFFPP